MRTVGQLHQAAALEGAGEPETGGWQRDEDLWFRHDHDHGQGHHGHSHHHRLTGGSSHGHSHDGPTVGETRPSSPSRGVAIDIGDGVGALILYAGAEREGLEVEIFPLGRPSLRQHVWVLEREVGSGSVFAAVFPSLPEGRYCVCEIKGGEPTQLVDVVGGAVAEERWA